MATWGSSNKTYTPEAKSSVNVMQYGAAGNGKTDDSQAFLKAWHAVCGAGSNSPILTIPAGKTFLLKPVSFKGPCKSAHVNIQVLGNIVAPSQKSAWNNNNSKTWIVFSDVKGLIVNGNGQIDGQGSVWWKSCKVLALSFQNCNNLVLQGLKHTDSQKNHISISNCHDVTVSGLQITAPEKSPNTDGIDISHSTNVRIQDCVIGTGDDCIAINDGCSYINISSVNCGPGHGISIGSLGQHGARNAVEEVHIKNCTFKGTENGARIKTWQGGSGYARRITFEKIILIAANNPIIIDQFYCDHGHCSNQTSAVEVSDVSYTNFQGTSSSEQAIKFKCSKSIGCTNIALNAINITSADPKKKTTSYCINAHGRSSGSVPNVDCLSQ
ncbi:unnamed protein product [Ilex paraguariensis]|uniref:Polygalacturonase n=1 Tax=Ilex paraguariensis TaxID=185542 RepID=A0ABC8SMN1_9AQUA